MSLLHFVIILIFGPRLIWSDNNVCVLESGRRVKGLATKTPYAFLLDGITPNSQLDVRLFYNPVFIAFVFYC